MRVRFFIPKETHCDFINSRMCQVLHHELSEYDGVEIVESSPDIIHIFGTYGTSSNKAEYYRKRNIPVVFTSIKGMLGLNAQSVTPAKKISLRSAIKNIAKNGTIIHTCGEQEKEAITNIAKHAITVVIANSTFTATTDDHHMATQFLDLYKALCASNDNDIKKKIGNHVDRILGNDNLTAIFCKHILYIRHRYVMGNIPQAYLDETSRILTDNDCDENEIALALKKLKATNFASYTMTLLGDRTNLTEGFIPIERKGGKIVEKMKNIIIQ